MPFNEFNPRRIIVMLLMQHIDGGRQSKVTDYMAKGGFLIC
jgi:hypothetical protein